MDAYARRSRSPPGRHDAYTARPDDAWTGRADINRPLMDTYRRRSPAPTDRPRLRGARLRSRSPVQIDRYQPGRLPRNDFQGPLGRDDSYRRRSPPPIPQGNIDRYVPGQDPPAPVVNPLPNPLNLEYQVGFNWFAEWWRKDQEVKEERERQKSGGRRPPTRLKGEQEVRDEREKERSQIQAAYDLYKEKLQVQMARMFVHQHKSEEWFKERYDPDIRDPFRKRLGEFRRQCYEQWQQDLDAGVFDEFTLEGIYKSESNGAGGVVEKEEGETTAAAEVLGVGDLLPSKGGELRDEAALKSALLIKTIAPHVSRDKMEAFCKEYLGESEGGFRWLSLSDPNPLKKCHRIGWVMLNPGGEQTEASVEIERGDGRDEEGEEDGENDKEDDGGDHVVSSTAMEGITRNPEDKALAAINGKSIMDEERGNFQCHVGIHVPPTMPRKKALWDLFSAPERIERDLQLVMRLVSKMEQELGEDINGVNKVEERVEETRSKGLLQPPNMSGGTGKAPRAPDEEAGEEGEDVDAEDEEEGAYDEETDDEDLLAKKKKLDLLVEYLRRVFNFCFFCVFESDSVHELTRKCPGGHLRRPRASLTSAAQAAAKASAYGEPFPLNNPDSVGDQEKEEGSPVEKRFNRNSRTRQQLQRAFNWVKTYEDKLFQILEPESADLKKLGGRPVEEALEEELKNYVEQQDVAKFRCKAPDCNKLFKAENFWRKHVEKRHTEWFNNVKKDLNLINVYVLDPAHITPSRSDANSNGHFATNNQTMTSTPRGFNLSAIPFGFPPGMMASMPNPANFPTTFGQYPVTMPPGNWGPSGASFGMVDPGGVGPMRRGGVRYNSRPNGPYDRLPRDNRPMRYNGAGRLTPPRGGGRPGGVPRFPDGAAGATVGPREAVAGRSLKSYEDLDAVEGSGNGELNY